MIDQSNRAGKLNINGRKDVNEQNSLSSVSSPTITKRHKSRALSQNKSRRSNPSVVFGRLSPSCLKKGKSV
jgi:hypothetical protein